MTLGAEPSRRRDLGDRHFLEARSQTAPRRLRNTSRAPAQATRLDIQMFNESAISIIHDEI